MAQTEKVRTAYLGRAATDYDALRFGTSAGMTIHRLESDLFASALQVVRPGAKVLEVGCGTGRFLMQACEAGMVCHGVDPSPDMLNQARVRITPKFPGTTFDIGEGANLPVESNAFDFVYSIRVLNQTESEAYALSIINEMLRAARNGGHVLIEFISSRRFTAGFSQKHDVRLAPLKVFSTARAAGADILWLRGAFFFGMTAQYATPTILRPLVGLLDRLFSVLAPGFCSRCYVLVKKCPYVPISR